jgi:hypothetical protein
MRNIKWFFTGKLLRYQKSSTDHMEAGGKHKTLKGQNPEMRQRIFLPFSMNIMRHSIILTNNFSRISSTNKQILKSVLFGFMFLFLGIARLVFAMSLLNRSC